MQHSLISADKAAYPERRKNELIQSQAFSCYTLQVVTLRASTLSWRSRVCSSELQANSSYAYRVQKFPPQGAVSAVPGLLWIELGSPCRSVWTKFITTGPCVSQKAPLASFRTSQGLSLQACPGMRSTVLLCRHQCASASGSVLSPMLPDGAELWLSLMSS